MTPLTLDSPSTPDWRALRRKFPLLAGCAYFNTASHGPVSPEAAAAARRYYEDWAWDYGPALLACREGVARFIGARPEEIGFVPNTSTAMTCAALLFEGHGAVLTARGEHPSVVTPWFARKYRVDVAAPRPDGVLTPECYARALKPDTRVIAVSHVRYNDGQVNDLAGLGELARAHKVHLVVDTIQSIGILPVDVANGMDIVGFAGFKWLNAGHGGGAIYVRDGLMARYGLPIAGNRSRETAELIEITRLAPLLKAQAFELGTLCVPNVLALGAALDLIRSIGPAQILERVRQLTRRLRRGLAQLGLTTRTDTAENILTPIVAVLVADVEKAAQALAAGGVQISVRGGALRIAVSWYNDEADVDRCLEVLSTTARQSCDAAPPRTG